MRLSSVVFLCMLLTACALAQESTGTIAGTVTDATGARLAGANVTVTNASNGAERRTVSDSEGRFAFAMLLAGDYTIDASAADMASQRRSLHLDVGGSVDLGFSLSIAGRKESVTVTATTAIETQAPAVSTVIDERAIEGIPLNGRRFSDLALLSPGVTQDPRSLTSSSNGDLAFGGVRGFQSSFYVDGVDNNNAFFAQARGRYRAPYQFSNEVVQEFRVSSNTYGAELGRSGGAVINVVTKSGSNYTHGSAFYYLRDSQFSATPGGLTFNPANRQQQFGFTLGGPIVRNKLFYYAGFDQHIFHVPALVRFLDGSTKVVPTPEDYEPSDQAQVFAAAAQLSTLAGDYRAALDGNAGFVKLDWVASNRHFLSMRLSTSRFYGLNNVFFDSASPITYYGISENGEEDVATESAVVSLTSTITPRLVSHLRVQFARDLQSSDPNSSDTLTKVYGIIEGFGRSNILPRSTDEHRLQIVESLGLEGKRHSWKFGTDISLVWLSNFFPGSFGGEYIFDNIRVNPWTFQPMTYGMAITPLRAYAHQVPRYYLQNFGPAVSHPDTREYAFFAQDTIRVNDHFAVSLGARYDLQTFRSDGLISNPLWPDSGKVPFDDNNIAPRVGFAWSIGDEKPCIIRGGYGIFFTRIPQMYNSSVETDNGLAQTHLFLDNSNFYDHRIFPTYPAPLVACSPDATSCTPPPIVSAHLTSEISSFAHDFQVPYVEQASLGVERELARRFALSVAYLYVHGEHLIRARDFNLPPPEVLEYPVFDNAGDFTNTFYPVDSFATWQMTRSFTCPFPPCINDVQRPIPQVGAINVFGSDSTSIYHGLTVSLLRRMVSGLYFRVAYTYAHATDDGQDALVIGRPPTVQNSYAPRLERGPSVTDQRHRFVASWVYEPHPFHGDHPTLSKIFNDWRIAGLVTVGSGRPFNARILGDANRDQNDYNDRLPGYSRNAFLGPDYTTTDLRLARRIYLSERFRLDFMIEAYNAFNRNNLRMDITDDGFLNSAGQFIPTDVRVGGNPYPGYYVSYPYFLTPTGAYAPRQIQFGIKLTF